MATTAPSKITDQWGNVIDPASVEPVMWGGQKIGYMFQNPLTNEQNYVQTYHGQVGTGSSGNVQYVRPDPNSGVFRPGAAPPGNLMQDLQSVTINGDKGFVFRENPLTSKGTRVLEYGKDSNNFFKEIAPALAIAAMPFLAYGITGMVGGAGAAGAAGTGAAAGGSAFDTAVAGGVGAEFGASAGVGFGAAEGFGAGAGIAAESSLPASFGVELGAAEFGAGASAAAGGGAGMNLATAMNYNPYYGTGAEIAGGSSGGGWLSTLANAIGANFGGGAGSGVGGIFNGGGPASTALNVGSGIYGLWQAAEMNDLARKAMNKQPYTFDPFGMGQRAPYAAQLAALMSNPALLEKYPGYQAGLQAVERTQAAQGYLGSGNMMAALSKYGGDAFNQETARLAQLSGANFPPSAVMPDTSGLAGLAAGANLGGRALGTLGYVLRSKGL